MKRVIPVLRLRIVALCLVLMSVLSGCRGDVALEHAYSFADRAGTFSASHTSAYTEPFAARLCVADGSDETNTSLTADVAAVFELNGQETIYQKNALSRMNPASTTKVMTAIVALKHGNLSDIVTVTEDAVIHEAGSSMAGVVPGDQITLRDLLYGLMIPSGNDAANAIAVHVGGSIQGFVDMMNEEARRIGATGTHFCNANGLTDPEHYTTAYDLYLMFREALTYETFREIIGTHTYAAEYTDAGGSPKTSTWGVGNYYMNGKRETPEGLTVFGGKTGTTQAAGYCLIMGSEASDGREFASVIMKADSRDALYDDMTEIISKIDK